MLIFTGDQFMSLIDISGGLLKGDWQYFATDLEVIVAHADGALSQSHHEGLGDCTATLVLEAEIDWEGSLSFHLVFNSVHLIKFWIWEVNHIASTVLETKKETLCVLVQKQLFLRDEFDFISSFWVVNSAQNECLELVGPVVHFDAAGRIKVVLPQGKSDQSIKVNALDTTLFCQRLLCFKNILRFF